MIGGGGGSTALGVRVGTGVMELLGGTGVSDGDARGGCGVRAEGGGGRSTGSPAATGISAGPSVRGCSCGGGAWGSRGGLLSETGALIGGLLLALGGGGALSGAAGLAAAGASGSCSGAASGAASTAASPGPPRRSPRRRRPPRPRSRSRSRPPGPGPPGPEAALPLAAPVRGSAGAAGAAGVDAAAADSGAADWAGDGSLDWAGDWAEAGVTSAAGGAASAAGLAGLAAAAGAALPGPRSRPRRRLPPPGPSAAAGALAAASAPLAAAPPWAAAGSRGGLVASERPGRAGRPRSPNTPGLTRVSSEVGRRTSACRRVCIICSGSRPTTESRSYLMASRVSSLKCSALPSRRRTSMAASRNVISQSIHGHGRDRQCSLGRGDGTRDGGRAARNGHRRACR